jgi:hypothetical protein
MKPIEIYVVIMEGLSNIRNATEGAETNYLSSYIIFTRFFLRRFRSSETRSEAFFSLAQVSKMCSARLPYLIMAMEHCVNGELIIRNFRM